MAHFRQFRSGIGCFSYLVADVDKREAVLIDPEEDQSSLYLSVLEELQARLCCVLVTHVHTPLPLPAQRLCAATGALLMAGEKSNLVGLKRYLNDNDLVGFGDELIRVLHTPGHTLGCVSFLWRDRLFSGDALLIGDCGATDKTGSEAGTLYDSITRRLLVLPDETLVYPAHDRVGRRVSCIGEERQNNPKLKGTTRDEFIALQTSTPEVMADFVPIATATSSSVVSVRQ